MAYFRCTTGGSGKGNTLVVTCADDLAGATITCTNGTKTYTKTCPSTSPYEVTFYGLMAGTWTVSATVSGDTYTTTVVVVDCVALLGGFNWRTWVDTAQFLDSSDYDSLDEVLADEEAVRELCLEHACVDYLADIATANEDVETIINTDLFAKWVNNSDYALDFLGANVVIKALMDEADKYFYGEWCLMPQVPTMTSNTAPYGEASASSTWQNVSAYYAFDGDNSHLFGTASGNTTGYVQYKFVNPTNVRNVRITNRAKNNYKDFRIQASNDNSNWTTLYTGTNPSNDENYVNEIAIANDEFFLYYRLQIDTAYQNDGSFVYVGCKKLQFYAWAPKGNVPVMTSNSAPYGEVSASSNWGSSSYAYYAFNNDLSNNWASAANPSWPVTLAWASPNPVCVKAFEIMMLTASPHNFKLQGYDGSNWVDIQSYVNTSTTAYDKVWFEVENNTTYYLQHRLSMADTNTGNNVGIKSLQFYGRELSVSVPVMTGNTTPYGECIGSTPSSDNRALWKAFDNDSSTAWNTYDNSGNNGEIGYVFTSKTSIRKAILDIYANIATGTTTNISVKLQTSSDGNTWEDISDLVTQSVAASQTKRFEILVNKVSSNRYYRVARTAGGDRFWVSTLQFYGLDYSEKEFEEGTTKKWLYDHGVELIAMDGNYGSSASTTRSATKEDSQIYYPNTGSNDITETFGISEAMDLTPYSLLRIKDGNKGLLGSRFALLLIMAKKTFNTNVSGNTQYAQLMITTMGKPIGIDISSINNNAYLGISSGYNCSYTFEELWLE